MTDSEAIDTLRVLYHWCRHIQAHGGHLVGSICKQADRAQFEHALNIAKEVLKEADNEDHP